MHALMQRTHCDAIRAVLRKLFLELRRKSLFRRSRYLPDYRYIRYRRYRIRYQGTMGYNCVSYWSVRAWDRTSGVSLRMVMQHEHCGTVCRWSIEHWTVGQIHLTPNWALLLGIRDHQLPLKFRIEYYPWSGYRVCFLRPERSVLVERL